MGFNSGFKGLRCYLYLEHVIIMVKSLWHFTKLFVFERHAKKKTVAHLTRVTLFEQVEAVALIGPA